MPTMSGVEATRLMKHASPATRVLILSGQGQGAVIRAAYAAGVSGYLSKNVRAADLLEAIRRTHAGESVFSTGSA
jgi:DNA-binding NarL/FixJ family response regulator